MLFKEPEKILGAAAAWARPGPFLPLPRPRDGRRWPGGCRPDQGPWHLGQHQGAATGSLVWALGGPWRGRRAKDNPQMGDSAWAILWARVLGAPVLGGLNGGHGFPEGIRRAFPLAWGLGKALAQ